MPHTHILVLIREFTGDHKVYWCRECGYIVEFFGSNFADMTPSWSKDRLLSEGEGEVKFNFEKEKFKHAASSKRLGKGLGQIRSNTPTFLKVLLK